MDTTKQFTAKENNPCILADAGENASSCFRSQKELIDFLELDKSAAPYTLLETSDFPFLVPSHYAALMKKGDWRDPLLLQVVIREDENRTKPGFVSDAVGDTASLVAPGLMHKYAGRVLLLASRCCAVHCRYCLRRSFPFDAVPVSEKEWENAWRYIQNHPAVREIILSGGDPLMLGNSQIISILERILAITHIRTVRIHTRIPGVLPGRIDRAILYLLKRCNGSKRVIIVIHINHPNELSAACKDTIRALRDTGAVLLNQSVLLRGVNDSAEPLAELCLGLVETGVLPYYLHQLDRVCGAAHFEVTEEEGTAIIDKLKHMIPGYAVPRYVRELAGAGCKVAL